MCEAGRAREKSLIPKLNVTLGEGREGSEKGGECSSVNRPIVHKVGQAGGGVRAGGLREGVLSFSGKVEIVERSARVPPVGNGEGQGEGCGKASGKCAGGTGGAEAG